MSVSATCTSDDVEVQKYDIFIEQHEANDLQDGDVEYANVSSVKVSVQYYC